jgi:hypothetical protein
MNFDGTVSPIGNLTKSQDLLDQVELQLKTGTLPIIQCAKYKCHCGLCAPKAQTPELYTKIIQKYQKGYTQCAT